MNQLTEFFTAMNDHFKVDDSDIKMESLQPEIKSQPLTHEMGKRFEEHNKQVLKRITAYNDGHLDGYKKGYDQGRRDAVQYLIDTMANVQGISPIELIESLYNSTK